jgi:O-antigen ligase
MFEKIPKIPKKKILFITIILGLIFVIKMGPEYVNRIGTIFDDVSSIRSGSKRILIWKRSLIIFSDYPVLGVGPYCFNTAYGFYVENDKFVGELSPVYDNWAAYKWATAHNSFILIMVEMGIIGLGIYLLILVRTLTNLKKANNIHNSRASDKIVLYTKGIKFSLIGFISCSFFLSQTYNPILYLLFFLSGALIRLPHEISQLKE